MQSIQLTSTVSSLTTEHAYDERQDDTLSSCSLLAQFRPNVYNVYRATSRRHCYQEELRSDAPCPDPVPQSKGPLALLLMADDGALRL